MLFSTLPTDTEFPFCGVPQENRRPRTESVHAVQNILERSGSNGKRPRSELGRNFSAFRTCGPIRRQRLPSTEDPLSDLDYDYGSSSDDGEWSTSTGSESMDMDMYEYDTEEEEMMLLDALEEEEELEEEEATDDEMGYVDFSTDGGRFRV
ncbi:hypothetical protein pipiens_006138 [Culex pipiens pipiens]|uniref:Uncharacterized protein n=1 Tax=Culex pipiens pipiens TaxID=38569 RepID=A0ABD1DRM7_CULPP